VGELEARHFIAPKPATEQHAQQRGRGALSGWRCPGY
jgi:hypothetical protein